MINIINDTNFSHFIEVTKYLMRQERFKHRVYDYINSYNANQLASKFHLINLLHKNNIFENVDTTAVLGCWYGSVLFPLLQQHSTHIIGYDKDLTTIKIGHKIHDSINHDIKLYNYDVWLDRIDDLYDLDLIINTSCEHMPPMKYWNKWSKLKHGTYLAFQSNNMEHIGDHINCCSSLEEFENQMPDVFDIISTTEIVLKNDYKRFTIIGQI